MRYSLPRRSPGLFALPEQFRRPVEIAGPVGVEERVDPGRSSGKSTIARR